MNFGKILPSVAAVLAFANAFCDTKFAFVAHSRDCRECTAVFNGARDALSELSKKYGQALSADFIAAGDGSKSDVLSKAHMSGYAGAVVVASPDSDKSTAKFDAKNFPVAAVGFDNKNAFYFCATDTDAAFAAIKREIKRLSGSLKPEIFTYVPAAANLNCPLEFPSFAADFAKLRRTEKIGFYSDYAAKNADAIRRRDDFGEIFAGVSMLANMAAISKDSDRAFALCLGSIPQLEFYLKSGQIDVCIYDDFYGWGYFAARALAEKSLEGVSPKKREYFVKPAVATKENPNLLGSDWAKWGR